jgi:hypothetical protein
MNSSDFSAAIKKIKEDCKLFGISRNHLAEPLRKNGCKVTVTRGEGAEKVIVEEYFVSPKEIAKESEI